MATCESTITNVTDGPEEGYRTITCKIPGQDAPLVFRFYRGFVGRIVYWPQGRGKDLPCYTCYENQDTYRLPPPPEDISQRKPSTLSTIGVAGGGSGMAFTLYVDNTPVKETVLDRIDALLKTAACPPGATGEMGVGVADPRGDLSAILVVRKSLDPGEDPPVTDIPCEPAGPVIEFYDNPKTCPDDC
jgi:hypothetical protein